MQAPSSSSPSFSLQGIELSLAGTLGVTFVCLNLAVFVTGITSLQAMQYFSRYKHDGWYNKLSVTLLWLLDLTNTVFIVLAGYRYFVIWYGNPMASMEVHVFLKTVVWTANTEIFLVHVLYSLRIWKLSRKQWPWFGGTISVFVISCAAAASAFSDYGFSTIDNFFDTHEVRNPYYFWVPALTATILDVILAATLLFYVKPKDTTFANAHSVVTTLLMYTVASGAATGLCSAVGLITFFKLPHTLVFVGSMFVMTKLYATSYLQLVCSRKRWRDKLAKPNMDMWEWEEDPPKLSTDSERPMLRSASPWALIHHGRSESRASTLIGFSK